MIDPDPTPDEALGGSQTTQEERVDSVDVAAPIVGEESLLPDRSLPWMDRWNEIQLEFVDQPRRSIEEANMLVTEVLDELTVTFAQERDRLENQWNAGSEPATEDLRVALQRYRSLFNRLLAA